MHLILRTVNFYDPFNKNMSNPYCSFLQNRQWLDCAFIKYCPKPLHSNLNMVEPVTSRECGVICGPESVLPHSVLQCFVIIYIVHVLCESSSSFCYLLLRRGTQDICENIYTHETGRKTATMQKNLVKSFIKRSWPVKMVISRPIVWVFSDPALIQSCLFPHNLMSHPPVPLLQVFQAAFHAATSSMLPKQQQ